MSERAIPSSFWEEWKRRLRQGAEGRDTDQSLDILRRRAQAVARPLTPPAAETETEQLFCFRLGAARFAVAADQALSAFRLPSDYVIPGMPAIVPGLLHVRGQVMAVVSLSALLSLPAGTPAVAAIAGAGEDAAGFLADRVEALIVLPRQEIYAVPAHLGAPFTRFLRGVTGDMVMVLNLEEVFRCVRSLSWQ